MPDGLNSPVFVPFLSFQRVCKAIKTKLCVYSTQLNLRFFCHYSQHIYIFVSKATHKNTDIATTTTQQHCCTLLHTKKEINKKVCFIQEK